MQSCNITIRALRAEDVPRCMRLVELAGWNQTAEDWARLLRLARVWGLFADGELATTTSAYVHPDGVAWIGMVLTDPRWRGLGFASLLMEEALRMDARCFRLDATAMGAPLYRKFGFVDERAIERWERQPAPAEKHNALPSAGWGYEPRLLAELGKESCAVPGGFAMLRSGRLGWYFGPCLGENLSQCVDWAIGQHLGDLIFWDLFPDDAEAVRVATSRGFRRVRELVRMRRGPALPAPCNVHAICGFEFG